MQIRNTVSKKLPLPSDWYLDEVLLMAMPKKDGWGGLADDPRVMEVYRRASCDCVKGAL